MGAPDARRDDLDALQAANRAFALRYPGERGARQPVHTLYLGAQFFTADTTRRLGASALQTLDTYGGGEPRAFAEAIGLAPCDAAPAAAVLARVREKLEREAVEDLRIDFEDGFGRRSDDEEDDAAVATARGLARAVAAGTAPPFSGIRIQSLGGDPRRPLRTVERFVETLVAEAASPVLPPNFVVTLPKVTVPEQPYALARFLDRLEARLGLPPRSIGLEFMVETSHAFLGPDGRSPLRAFLDACAERCVGVHLGTYDYTASCGISAAAQSMAHPMCELARGMMILAYAGTGVFLSDGSTNVLPVGPHAPARGGTLTPAQLAENREAVHRAWRLSCGHIRHSLRGGFYQGWDLHPAQLPVRFAACFDFYLEGFPSAAARLRNFVATQPTGARAEAGAGTTQGGANAGIADEPATAQALWNYVRRAYLCGAIDARDLDATGLSASAIGVASLAKVLEARASAVRGARV